MNPTTFKEKSFHLFKIKDAKQFPQADFLGGQKGSQGDSYFTCNNPPYGATFTYFNRDGFKSLKAKRKEAEAKARKAGEDAREYLTAEELEKEEAEVAPQLMITIRDQSDQLVRTLTAGVRSGVQRVNWDLRNGRFAYVAPGEYSITVELVSNNEAKKLAGPTNFKVVACIDPAIPYESQQQVNAFYDEVYALQQKVRGASNALSHANELLDEYEQAIQQDGKPHLELKAALSKLRSRSREISKLFSNGSPQDSRVGNRRKPSIQSRLGNAGGSLFSLAGPTQTHRDSLKIAQEMYAKVYPELKKFAEEDVKAFGEKIQQAGLGWTTGQPVPKPGK